VSLQHTALRKKLRKKSAFFVCKPSARKESTRKLIIAGSRTFTDYQLLCQTLAPERHRITQVLTGGARGADQLAYRWAWKHAVKHQMAQAGDMLLAFWDGRSPGTRHIISCMQQLGKPVGVVRFDTKA
jgi:hypothetical protein